MISMDTQLHAKDELIDIPSTPYCYAIGLADSIAEIAARVQSLRSTGRLTPEVLGNLRRYFKIKNIYNSNAIEGNTLNVGETELVVQQGLTLTGKPLRDQAEARNLSEALDFLEDMASCADKPITETDIRQMHAFVLKGINDEEAGRYRRVTVVISGSKYAPPPAEDVGPQMLQFCNWLAAVTTSPALGTQEGLLYAAVAHTWFVTIHPFIDGNGRVARLLMNLVLMRYGYPIAIITREDRQRYYDALEESQSSNLSLFLALVIDCLTESLEEYESAAQEQRERLEWAQSLAARLGANELATSKNKYEVWRRAMELFEAQVAQLADMVNQSLPLVRIQVREFGELEFEKYLSLSKGHSAKKTWFFRIDFRAAHKVVRYLFFFGSASPLMSKEGVDVTVLVAREEPPGSFYYERLENIDAPNVPDIVEIGYKMRDETFVARNRNGKVVAHKVERIVQTFFEQVTAKHFAS